MATERTAPPALTLREGPNGPLTSIYRVDAPTGVVTAVVPFPPMWGWAEGPVIDRTATHAYILGPDEPLTPTVYTADLVAGTSTAAPLADGKYGLAGVTDSGSVVAIHWTGSTESVHLIDPTTGTATPAGEIAQVQAAGGEAAAYDHAAHVVYDAFSLAGTSAVTGSSTPVPRPVATFRYSARVITMESSSSALPWILPLKHARTSVTP